MAFIYIKKLISNITTQHHVVIELKKLFELTKSVCGLGFPQRHQQTSSKYGRSINSSVIFNKIIILMMQVKTVHDFLSYFISNVSDKY